MRKPTPGMVSFILFLLTMVLLIIVSQLSGSVNATKISERTAQVEADGRLTIIFSKTIIQVTREGNDVVVSSLLEKKYPLCGAGCTVEVPIPFSDTLYVREIEDGSLVIEWPPFYMMY